MLVASDFAQKFDARCMMPLNAGNADVSSASHPRHVILYIEDNLRFRASRSAQTGRPRSQQSIDRLFRQSRCDRLS
jgi:hypothetical protein